MDCLAEQRRVNEAQVAARAAARLQLLRGESTQLSGAAGAEQRQEQRRARALWRVVRPSMIKDMADDEATQATNDDASECKRSAVQLGYWDDSFIGLFVKQPNRKAPEINRGYYARVKGIEFFVDKFLQVGTGGRTGGEGRPPAAARGSAGAAAGRACSPPHLDPALLHFVWPHVGQRVLEPRASRGLPTPPPLHVRPLHRAPARADPCPRPPEAARHFPLASRPCTSRPI